jgi:hypothetical protein
LEYPTFAWAGSFGQKAEAQNTRDKGKNLFRAPQSLRSYHNAGAVEIEVWMFDDHTLVQEPAPACPPPGRDSTLEHLLAPAKEHSLLLSLPLYYHSRRKYKNP